MIQQTKTLPASQVKNHFGTIASQVKNGTFVDVVVENRGEPIVAIVNIEDREALREFRERKRRAEALDRLRNIRAHVQAKVVGKLSGKEANDSANRFSRELIEDLEREGKVRFERKSP